MVGGAVAFKVGARTAASLVATALLLGQAWLSYGQPSTPAPAGEVTVSFHVTLAPSWFDPSTAPPQITPFGVLYAVHDALVRPLPGAEDGPELGRVVDGERRRARLRVQAAPRAQVPQWRSGDGRRRQVELRALPGRRREAAPGARAPGGGGRSADAAHPFEGALAGFHDLLRHHRHRGRDRSAEEVLRVGRRRRLPAASGRRGSLQVREPASGRRRGRWRPTRATGDTRPTSSA